MPTCLSIFTTVLSFEHAVSIVVFNLIFLPIILYLVMNSSSPYGSHVGFLGHNSMSRGHYAYIDQDKLYLNKSCFG